MGCYFTGPQPPSSAGSCVPALGRLTVCVGAVGGGDGKSWKYPARMTGREVVRSEPSGCGAGGADNCGPSGSGGTPLTRGVSIVWPALVLVGRR